MGSGKSHWGRIWAKKYGYNYYDLDEEIEKATKMTVEQIFSKRGEKAFRELEKNHLQRLVNEEKLLVSCGGGTPCFFENMDWMLQNGIVIYLKTTPDIILKRVMDETDKRPLLKQINSSELLFFIEKKLKEREPVYLKAHHVLETAGLSEEALSFFLEENQNL
jgi:shikimate kinase